MTDTPLPDLTAAAEAAVAALEALKPGAWVAEQRRQGIAPPWADAEQAAERAVEALYGAAVTALFPAIIGTADAVRLLEFHTAASGWHAQAIAALHSEAIEAGNEDLARLVRSAAVLNRVGDEGIGQRDHRAELVRLIAGQLTGADASAQSASIVVDAVPALRGRIATAVKRCAAEAEQRARSELGAWFRQRAGVIFRAGLSRRACQLGDDLADNEIRGAELAALIEAGNARAFDHAGHLHEHHPQGGGRPSRGMPLFTTG